MAGECRYRAALQAGLQRLPAIVRLYTDEQALEIQLVENIFRSDLTPLEQARGYRALIATNPDKHSVYSIAGRIGMSPAWVWDRLKLLDLIPVAQELLESERIAIGHAILLARLTPEQQERIISPKDPDMGGLFTVDRAELGWHDEDEEREPQPDDRFDHLKPVSIRELEAWIAKHVRFNVQQAAQAVPLVFEDLASRVEQAQAKPGRGKKVAAITFEHFTDPDARDESERTFGPQSWKAADGQDGSKACEFAVLGVVVAGPRRGDAFEVCLAKDRCQVHWKQEIADRAKNRKLREDGKEPEAREREAKGRSDWEKEQAARELERKRWDALQPVALQAIAARVKLTPATDRILAQFIDEHLGGYRTAPVKKLLGGPITLKNFGRAAELFQVVYRSYSRIDCSKIAKRYGVDLAKLEKSQIAAETPTAPKKKAVGKKGRTAA